MNLCVKGVMYVCVCMRLCVDMCVIVCVCEYICESGRVFVRVLVTSAAAIHYGEKHIDIQAREGTRQQVALDASRLCLHLLHFEVTQCFELLCLSTTDEDGVSDGRTQSRCHVRHSCQQLKQRRQCSHHL